MSAFINCVSIETVNWLLHVSIFVHVVGSLVIIIGLPIAASSHLDAATVWTRFQPGNWDAAYGRGAARGSNANIFTGYVANDKVNVGGNGSANGGSIPALR